MTGFKYQVALTFAGERRPYVNEVVDQLSKHIARDKILYDQDNTAQFSRADLLEHLLNRYQTESELIVVFLCGEYMTKPWCKKEWATAQKVIDERGGESVMLLEFEKVDLPGIYKPGRIDLTKQSESQVADLILQRLSDNRKNRPERARTPKAYSGCEVAIWTESGGKTFFFTGVPVVPDRILTVARDLPSDPGEIKVGFASVDGQADRHKADVVWNGLDADLNAAVLACRFPDEFQPLVIDFVSDEPTADNCTAAALLNTGAEPEVPKPFSMRGKLRKSGDDLIFNLDETAKLPVETELSFGGPLWSASGRLCGIIEAIVPIEADDPTTDAATLQIERIQIIPAWKLIAADGFHESLGGVSQEVFDTSSEQWRKKIAVTLRLKLKQITSDDFRDLFELKFGREIPSDRQQLVSLADELANDPYLARNIASLSVDCRDAQLVNEAELLDDLERDLIPTMFSDDERRRFWNQLRFRSAVLVEHAVTGPAAAESRMAAFEGRRLRLAEDESSPIERWKGQAAVRFGHIKPGDLSADQVAFRILLELAADRLGADQLTGTAKAREEILTGQASERTFESALAERQLLSETLNKTLQESQGNFGCPYCVVRVEDTGFPRERLKDALAILKQWVPELDFLEISNKTRHGHHEAPVLERLRLTYSSEKQK